MALKYLQALATQGSADAFVEVEFQTGLSNVTRSAFRIRTLEWQLGQALPSSADCMIQTMLRRNSTAALSVSNPNAVIAYFQRASDLTTSGVGIQELGPNVIIYPRDLDLLIVEESLFLQVDSAATGLANVAWVRIGYEVRTITENERLSVQAATSS